MNTLQRATHLCEALNQVRFDSQSTLSPSDLIQWLTGELGHPEILDRFVKMGDQFTRAIAPVTVLHVLSGNTPEAAIQSLTRTLLLGCQNNWLKLPSSPIPKFEEFLNHLPPGLVTLRSNSQEQSTATASLTIASSHELPSHWLTDADVITVFGSDRTIETLRTQTKPHQKFIPYGRKISIAAIAAPPSRELAQRLAHDVAQFDQLGCLSPIALYLAPPFDRHLPEWGETLAAALEDHELKFPRQLVAPDIAAQLQATRADYKFRATLDPRIRLWESPNSTAWTVITDPSPQLIAGPAHRTIRIHPLPNSTAAFGNEIKHLSSISIYPPHQPFADQLAYLNAPRVCPLGQAQNPSLFWHHDGRASLAELVNWQDRQLPAC